MKPTDKIFSEIAKDRESVIPIRSDSALDKIKPMTLNEIKSSNPSPIEDILFPWLPIKGSALIYSAAGVGKTFFTLNVAYAIAAGGNFLKFKAPKPRKVLYIDGEMSYPNIYSRLMNIMQQQGMLDECIENNFLLLTPDKIFPLFLPKIDTSEGQHFYNKIIKENNIDVIIFDNFATLSLFDENIAEEWKFLQDWFIYLRASGKTIIAVHHAGKEKKGYRGTSRMLDCVDTALSLQELSNNTSEEETIFSKRFKIDYQKSRTFGGKDSLPFEVTFTQAGWQHESVENNNTKRIIDMYAVLDMRQVNIARELNVSESYVSKILKQHKVDNIKKLNKKV